MLIRPAVATDVPRIMATHVAAVRQLCSAAYEADQISAWVSGSMPERYLRAMAEHVFSVAVLEGEVALGFVLDEMGSFRLRSGLSLPCAMMHKDRDVSRPPKEVPQ